MSKKCICEFPGNVKLIISIYSTKYRWQQP